MGSEVEEERSQRITYCRSGEKRSGLFNWRWHDSSSGEDEISRCIGNGGGVNAATVEGVGALLRTIRVG